jgi:hypothetical protein
MVHWFMPVHLLSLPNWRGSGLVVVEHLTPFNFAAANPKNYLCVFNRYRSCLNRDQEVD